MGTDFSQRFRRWPLWGLHHPPRDDALARAIESRWRWVVLPALCATVPAFYAELLGDERPPWATAASAAFVVFLLGIHAPSGDAIPRTQNSGQARLELAATLRNDITRGQDHEHR